MVGEAIYYVDNNGRGVYFMIIVVKRFTVRKDVSLSTYYPFKMSFTCQITYVVQLFIIFVFAPLKGLYKVLFVFGMSAFKSFEIIACHWFVAISLQNLLHCKQVIIYYKGKFFIIYIHLSLRFRKKIFLKSL